MNEKEKLIKDWEYFLSKINFRDSAMDAKAIFIMNTFSKRIRSLK